MPSLHRCLTALGAVVLALGAAACVDSSRCDAVLASTERTRAEMAQRDAQLTWLRWQLATFASELSARNAADREVLLQKLTALETANTQLARRLERAQLRADLPLSEPGPRPQPSQPREVAPSPPAAATPLPPAPPETAPPRPVRQVEARAGKARGIDETSPY